MERQPLLVGFHGVKRSGKDTAATYLEEWCRGRSLSFARRGFADKAKLAFARQFYPTITMADAIAWVDEHKDKGRRIAFPSNLPKENVSTIDFRQCVAQFATEGARLIYGEDHWVDQLLPLRGTSSLAISTGWWEEFSIFHGEGLGAGVADVCAIRDMRFDNELERVRLLGGVNVKIRRKSAEDAAWAQSSIHESELGLPDEEFDYVLGNNSTLIDFRQLIFNLGDALIAMERV